MEAIWSQITRGARRGRKSRLVGIVLLVFALDIVVCICTAIQELAKGNYLIVAGGFTPRAVVLAIGIIGVFRLWKWSRWLMFAAWLLTSMAGIMFASREFFDGDGSWVKGWCILGLATCFLFGSLALMTQSGMHLYFAEEDCSGCGVCEGPADHDTDTDPKE